MHVSSICAGVNRPQSSPQTVPLCSEQRACFMGLLSCRQGPDPPRVLLPGAGLGRLCVEVAAAGFEAQGNEFSYFMLITAAFMLNATACAEQWTIHPWAHLTCNNITDADQLRGVAVPDLVPSDVVPPGMLSMCAGDFAVRASWCWLCQVPGMHALLQLQEGCQHAVGLPVTTPHWECRGGGHPMLVLQQLMWVYAAAWVAPCSSTCYGTKWLSVFCRTSLLIPAAGGVCQAGVPRHL